MYSADVPSDSRDEEAPKLSQDLPREEEVVFLIRV
jgi:hypothetical protein